MQENIATTTNTRSSLFLFAISKLIANGVLVGFLNFILQEEDKIIGRSIVAGIFADLYIAFFYAIFFVLWRYEFKNRKPDKVEGMCRFGIKVIGIIGICATLADIISGQGIPHHYWPIHIINLIISVDVICIATHHGKKAALKDTEKNRK